jgi:hypothetical protein
MDILDQLATRLHELQRRIEALETQEAARWVYLQTPLTSAAWSGSTYSTVSDSTQIDLSAVFGVPANAKAALLYIQVKDSAGLGDYYIRVGPNATYYYAMIVGSISATVYNYGGPCVVPCDANGDIWYRIAASGANTLAITMRVAGYQL